MAEQLGAAGEGNQAPSEDQMEEDTNQQMQVDPEILKELSAVMSTSYKYPLDDEGLKECITKASVDPKKLSNFFKNVEARYKNSDQGEKTSWWSRLLSWIREKISTPSSQPSMIPPVYTVKVQPVSTGLTCGADDEILEKVKTRLSSTTQVEITDYQECDIIIVFCPITSRVGSDVPAAMRKIPGDKRVILVLMHHTRDVDYSTDVKKWSETFQNVVLDVHVLFHETLRGLLKSPRNDEAVHQIQKVLKAFNRSSWL